MGTRRVQKRAFKGRKFGYLKVHRIRGELVVIIGPIYGCSPYSCGPSYSVSIESFIVAAHLIS